MSFVETKPETVNERFEIYFNSRDLEGLLSLYEEDATFVPEPGKTLQGKSAIRSSLEGFMGVGGTIRLSGRYCVVNGDLALNSSEWTLSGGAAELSGKTTEVLRRQTDGNWKFVLDHPWGAS